MNPPVVLVVDDDEANRLLLREILETSAYRVELASDGLEALAKLKLGIDLVLLDLVMPAVDGFEVLRRIRAEEDLRDLPVIMITGLNSGEQRRRALKAGASDFITKPFERLELEHRIRALLRLREANDVLRRRDRDIEAKVALRLAALRRSIEEAVTAQREAWQAHLDTIHRLALACEFKDHDTAAHLQRISHHCALLGQALGLEPGEVELLRDASPMHDVGKIGIPDSILLKPGPLTAAERRIMETHAEIGARILHGSPSPLLKAGEVIALSHHERWDGAGYPRRLRGQEIPLWGRICAVADFFDALTSPRVYRPAVPPEDTLAMMRERRGTRFDPEVLDAFFGLEPQVLARTTGLDPTAAAKGSEPKR